MKKIIILLLMIITSLMVIVQPAYALTSAPEDISDELSWSVAATDGYYYAQSNRILIDFAEVEMEFGAVLGDWAQAFIAAIGPYNSVLEIYDDNETGSLLNTYNIAYEIPDAPDVLFLFDETPGDYNVDLRLYKDKYMQITLMLNPDAEPASPSLITNAEFYLNNYKLEYTFTINTYYDILDDQTIANLPVTSGNPYQSGQTGVVSEWAYNDVTNTFSANVNYYSQYNLSIPNVGFTDDAFLSAVQSIDYYTIDGEKFFQFNFIQNDNVLLTGSGQFAKKWNGFALWNLSTNEFVMYNKALALTYIEVTEDREIYGYLYLPNIPVDDLIAVSGNFNYRYGYKNFFGTQKYEEWQKAVFFLEKDEVSYGSQSVWEGALPQWSYDLLAGSLAATAIGTILTMVPGLQPIGIPLLAAGVAGIVVTDVAAINQVITGKTNEIETIIPTLTLRSTLNEHYTKAAGAVTVLPTNAQVHKLFYGLFTKTNTNVVEPDADTLVYTEITWATKGQVYTLDAEIIDSEAVLDEDYMNNLPPEGSGSWFNLDLSDIPSWLLWAGIIFAIFVIAPLIDKGTGSLSNIFKNRNKVVILIILAIIFLIATGIIRI